MDRWELDLRGMKEAKSVWGGGVDGLRRRKSGCFGDDEKVRTGLLLRQRDGAAAVESVVDEQE